MDIILTLIKDVVIPIVISLVTVNIKFSRKKQLENEEYRLEVINKISILYRELFNEGEKVNEKNVKLSLRKIDAYKFTLKKHRLEKTFLDELDDIILFGAIIVDDKTAIIQDSKIREKISEL